MYAHRRRVITVSVLAIVAVYFELLLTGWLAPPVVLAGEIELQAAQSRELAELRRLANGQPTSIGPQVWRKYLGRHSHRSDMVRLLAKPVEQHLDRTNFQRPAIVSGLIGDDGQLLIPAPTASVELTGQLRLRAELNQAFRGMVVALNQSSEIPHVEIRQVRSKLEHLLSSATAAGVTPLEEVRAARFQRQLSSLLDKLSGHDQEELREVLARGGVEFAGNRVGDLVRSIVNENRRVSPGSAAHEQMAEVARVLEKMVQAEHRDALLAAEKDRESRLAMNKARVDFTTTKPVSSNSTTTVSASVPSATTYRTWWYTVPTTRTYTYWVPGIRTYTYRYYVTR